MQLRAGQRLASTVCDAEVVVVKAPSDDVDLRCGGAAMVEPGAAGRGDALDATVGEAVQLGKRYADDDLGVELLCTKAGQGALSIGGDVLHLKGAKPLPSSD